MKTIAAASASLGLVIAVFVIAGQAVAQSSAEDRYIASRDAAIRKLKPLSGGKIDDAATKAEEAARAGLETSMRAVLGPVAYGDFGAGKLNLGSLFEGDEDYGTLDGLVFDAKLGITGETAGSKDKAGGYIEPRAHIIVTTQTLFERWLRAHKDWWDKGVKNVPQQIGAALKDESFYTQAFMNGSAVVKFNELPVTKPVAAKFATAMLAGRTQSEVPDAADEVFVAAIVKGKVYVAYGKIEPSVKVPACDAIRAEFNKKAADGYDDFQQRRIDQATYDRLENFRQQGEDAFKACFTERSPKLPAFRDAIKQAQALLEKAVGK